VSALDDEPPFQNVRTVLIRVFEHAAQVNFIERAIVHALQEMGAQLEFPFPPRWPMARCQRSLQLSITPVSCSAGHSIGRQRQLLAETPNGRRPGRAGLPIGGIVALFGVPRNCYLNTLLLEFLLLEYLAVETPKDSRPDADLLDFCQIQHLDEIGDLPLETQPKVLRFLDSKEIHPLGEATPQRVAVRIVAATNADLERDPSSRTAT